MGPLMSHVIQEPSSVALYVMSLEKQHASKLLTEYRQTDAILLLLLYFTGQTCVQVANSGLN